MGALGLQSPPGNTKDRAQLQHPEPLMCFLNNVSSILYISLVMFNEISQLLFEDNVIRGLGPRPTSAQKLTVKTVLKDSCSIIFPPETLSSFPVNFELDTLGPFLARIPGSGSNFVLHVFSSCIFTLGVS